MEQVFKVTVDCLFKYIFGDPNSVDILISFINAVLEDSGFIPIIEAKIQNPFNLKEHFQDKDTILDLKVTDENGSKYHIEMQTQEERYFKYRSLYYWSKMYSTQIKKAEEYGSLKPVICINILDFIMFTKTQNPHQCF